MLSEQKITVMWTRRLCLLCCAVGAINAQGDSDGTVFMPSKVHLEFKLVEPFSCPEISWNPPSIKPRGYETVCTGKTQYGNQVRVRQITKADDRNFDECLPAGIHYICSVYALKADLRSQPGKVNFTVPRGEPCKPVVELDSRDGNHVRIKWKLDCDGGFPILLCQLRRNFKPFPGTYSNKKVFHCQGDGKFSFIDETIHKKTAYTVYVENESKKGKRYDSTSEILFVNVKDVALVRPEEIF